MVTRQIGPGMFQQCAKEECDECPNVKFSCDLEGISEENEPGMPDGLEILFVEEGEAILDGDTGDLRLRVTTARHELFVRDGNDFLSITTSPSLMRSLVFMKPLCILMAMK